MMGICADEEERVKVGTVVADAERAINDVISSAATTSDHH
jgi:hypothetical protein